LDDRTGAFGLWVSVGALVLVAVPGLALRFTGADVDPALASAAYGAGIVAGAFLLSWAAEVAELDISASLAIAILALIAVLPEYAIEAVLAWDAGASFDPATGAVTEETSRVAANVTGSNRLLIGLGWSAVILIFWLRRGSDVDLRGQAGVEIALLAVVTAALLPIVVMGQVHIVLALGLIGIYIAYLWIGATSDAEEPELVGTAARIAALPVRRRRIMVVCLFLYAAAVILATAEPFVDGLVAMGTDFGVDEFILIQWIAPLASESPEVIVAVMFALRAQPVAGLTMLISASVNQLTLLVGSMAVLFSLSAGEVLSFPLDDRQATEFLLTAAVSAVAVLLIARRVVAWSTGAILLLLFAAHLFFPASEDRLRFVFIYLGVALGLIATDWRRVRYIFGGEP
jgi:cation:H+ antiporter